MKKHLFLLIFSIGFFSCAKESFEAKKQFTTKHTQNVVSNDELSIQVKDGNSDCLDWFLVTYGTDGRIYNETYLYTSCPNTQGSSGGSGVVVTPPLVKDVPCPSSFGFVTRGNYQIAVITDYRFGLHTNGRDYWINVGAIEIGMPYKTYHEDYVRNAAGLAVQAASAAEGKVVAQMSAALATNPSLGVGAFDNFQYKNMFKNAYQSELNKLLRYQYYPGESIDPNGRIYTDNFGLQDPTQYRTMKFLGKDC